MQNLLYGLNQDRELVSVYDVVKGLPCKCTCPGCGGQLIARQGEQKQWHFAHYNAEECSTGYQTSIHLLGKEIIKRNKKILVPVTKYKGDVINCEYDNYPYGYNINNKMCYGFGRYETALVIGMLEKTAYTEVLLDDVYLEQKEGDIIPDIVVVAKGRKILIEIYVTHKVDAEKLKKIKSLGLSCIEIDLSKIDRGITEDVLEEKIYDRSNIVSLYNAKDSTRFQLALEKFKNSKFVIDQITPRKGTFCHLCKRMYYNGKAYRMKGIYFCESCYQNIKMVLSRFGIGLVDE